MTAEIVSVGTELLLGQIVDTNAAYLGRALSEVGIAVYRRTTVGDNRQRLRSALEQALASADVVFTIGGLGPTMDDITRDVLSEVTGVPLVFSEEIAAQLRAFFEKRGRPLLDSQQVRAHETAGWPERRAGSRRSRGTAHGRAAGFRYGRPRRRTGRRRQRLGTIGRTRPISHDGTAHPTPSRFPMGPFRTCPAPAVPGSARPAEPARASSPQPAPGPAP